MCSGFFYERPDAFTDNLTINISNDVKDINMLGLTIADESGRIVYVNNSITYRNTLNLKDLAVGIYFVNVNSGKERATFKVVKIN